MSGIKTGRRKAPGWGKDQTIHEYESTSFTETRCPDCGSSFISEKTSTGLNWLWNHGHQGTEEGE